MATVPETKPKRVFYYSIPVEVPELPDFDALPDEDGENLETDWHRLAMSLLIDLVCWLYRERTDYYVGGNMFIYFSEEQFKGARFRGPDFFFIKGVSREPIRRKWVVMREGGKYPDVIIELMSETTAKDDLTTKKQVYETVFHTHEYYCYDPETRQLQGWRLVDGSYQDIPANEHGWLWCKELNRWIGTWEGKHPGTGIEAAWLRFYDTSGTLVPHRSEAAEAEVARLKALLMDKGTPQ